MDSIWHVACIVGTCITGWVPARHCGIARLFWFFLQLLYINIVILLFFVARLLPMRLPIALFCSRGRGWGSMYCVYSRLIWNVYHHLHLHSRIKVSIADTLWVLLAALSQLCSLARSRVGRSWGWPQGLRMPRQGRRTRSSCKRRGVAGRRSGSRGGIGNTEYGDERVQFSIYCSRANAVSIGLFSAMFLEQMLCSFLSAMT